MKVRITQLDGVLPNLALMRISQYHRERGDEIFFTRSPYRGILEPSHYDRVYGSAIFSFSAKRVASLRREFPEAIVGGTWDTSNPIAVEDVIALPADHESYDYTNYPDFDASLGFTARGCRLKCGFCVVPKKEGAPRSVNTIYDIWRGDPYPRHLHLLDNDFFGQPREQWEARTQEIVDGGFKVCFFQGINIRMIDEASAKAIGAIQPWASGFNQRHVYTAWDNLGDEKRFFNGVELLEKHGTPASRLFVYMLIGYDKRETWDRVLYRFERMTALRIMPYPMIYGDNHRTLPVGTADPRLADHTLQDFKHYAMSRRRSPKFPPFAEFTLKGYRKPSEAVYGFSWI